MHEQRTHKRSGFIRNHLVKDRVIASLVISYYPLLLK